MAKMAGMVNLENQDYLGKEAKEESLEEMETVLVVQKVNLEKWDSKEKGDLLVFL